MPPTSSRSRRPDDAGQQDTETSPSKTSPLEDMRQADIANGENPDEETAPPPPETPPAGGGSHPTGEQQASDNRENDPPA